MSSEFLTKRTSCRLCGSAYLKSVLRLNPTPPANEFVKKNDLEKIQNLYPLELFFCQNCTHVQLLDIVNPRVLFSNYVYVSGTSAVFRKHFYDYYLWINKLIKLNNDSLVIDIGSNDGTLLKIFKDNGVKVLGVDPAVEIAKKASENGIETLPLFFDAALAKRIRNEYSSAKVITANNVFAHADNLLEIIQGVKDLLSDDGVFIFEVSYLVDVLNKTLFDTIYHEHLSYHNVTSLKKFFKKNGLELKIIEQVNSHGGSLRGLVTKNTNTAYKNSSVDALINSENEMGIDKLETYFRFNQTINVAKNEVNTFLNDAKKQGKKIAGFGAPAKATTLMYHFEFTSSLIDFIVDDSPLKQGLFSPGYHIPVLGSDALYEKKPDFVLILAWNFADSIIENHQNYLKQGGKFIIPLPTMEIIE